MVKFFAVAMALIGLASAYEKCSSMSDMPADILTVDLGNLNWKAIDAIRKNGVQLSHDGYLRFSIAGNPTTGFQWDVNTVATNGIFEVCGDYVVD